MARHAGTGARQNPGARSGADGEAERIALARTLCREEGKTLKESLVEVQRSINILEFTAGEGRRMGGETVPERVARKILLTRFKQPLGVVGAITPWNFPVAIPVWKAAPALVAGNTMVLKPAELTPECAAKVVEIFAGGGLARGRV